ncbi:MAG: hypothetical protein FWD60_07890 [Candidatus Azobacteroides sp.]|nr:hypothetical protein [Candidatus Azobacteroides sp.]
MNYRRTLSVVCVAMLCYTRLFAQENPVENYLQQAGDYADIYNGAMEASYNTLLYDNLPYYNSPNFEAATIFYRKCYYPNQKARLDLCKEQLIVSTTNGRYGIILNSLNVEKIIIYGKTFRWLNPAKESGLKQGYYIHLSEGKSLQLFCKESYILQPNMLSYGFRDKRLYRFDQITRYYLLYSGQYYAVKDKSSFSKLLPQYKKQINQFAKEHHLKFKKEDSAESLTSLAAYCDELLIPTNKQ